MTVTYLPRHRRQLHPSEMVGSRPRSTVTLAAHDHAPTAPSCPACDPIEYSVMDAQHRSDV